MAKMSINISEVYNYSCNDGRITDIHINIYTIWSHNDQQVYHIQQDLHLINKKRLLSLKVGSMWFEVIKPVVYNMLNYD